MSTPCPMCEARGRIEGKRPRTGLFGKLMGPERTIEKCPLCGGTGVAHEAAPPHAEGGRAEASEASRPGQPLAVILIEDEVIGSAPVPSQSICD
jgi:hypothetical protein